MTLSLEGWPTKAKEAPSPHEVRMSLLDTNPVFQSLGGNTRTTRQVYESSPEHYKNFLVQQFVH